MPVTNIPAPRIPFIDERTGLMAREWYRFFVALFNITGLGYSTISIEDLQVSNVSTDVAGEIAQAEQETRLASITARYETLTGAIEAAMLQPILQQTQAQEDIYPPIQVGTLGQQNADRGYITGYMDFWAQNANPPAPAAGMARFHSATTQGFTRFEQDNEATTNIVLGRDNVFIARNTTGSIIASRSPVYVTGSTGNVPNIALAKSNAIATLPAAGLTLDAIGINAYGQVMKLGIISNVNTSAFSTGASLYVDPTTAGALTATRPVTPNLVQRMASVLVSGVGNGSLLVVTAPFVGGLDSGTTATTWKFNGFTLSMTADSSISGTNTGDVAAGPTAYMMMFAHSMQG